MIRLVIILLAAYLLGSIPTGLWIGRLTRGIDIRTVGSGRTGATNTQRTLGTPLAITVLGLDALKGALAVVVVIALTGDAYLGAAAGVAAMMGHILPLFAGFRGGRGVATGTGALVVLAPAAVLATMVLLIVVIAATRYVSLGSVLSAVVAPIFVALLRGRFGGVDAALVVALAGMVLVLAAHADNLQRLREGRENKFAIRGASPA